MRIIQIIRPRRAAAVVLVAGLASGGALAQVAEPGQPVAVIDRYGAWVREVPEAQGKFMGKPLHTVIDGVGVGGTPKQRDLALVDEILANLPAILRQAEAALTDYEKDTGRDYVSHITNVQIWIRDDRDHPKDWTLVAERDDWEDFGWHIEFNGSHFVEIWAAD